MHHNVRLIASKDFIDRIEKIRFENIKIVFKSNCKLLYCFPLPDHNPLETINVYHILTRAKQRPETANVSNALSTS